MQIVGKALPVSIFSAW